MANPKKQSFLGGAAVLAGAAAVVKLIGAVYKIPLNNILGQVGKTYFDTAYSIYNVLLTISTAGLPLAISKLTSQAHAQGRENQKRKLFRTALWLFFVPGLVGSVFMVFRAESLAAYMNTPMARLPIRTLAPAVFCVCLLACMRGYTQGQGNMTPTAVSQILEALCKVGIGLPCAWYLIQLGRGLDAGAAGAIMGVTAGTVLSMCFLIVYLLRHRERERSLDVPESSGALLRQILAIGIPITLSNSAMSIINLIAGNLSIEFQAKGSCLGIVTACASGTHAIGEAFRNIKHGYADVMIAGGAEKVTVRSPIRFVSILTSEQDKDQTIDYAA